MESGWVDAQLVLWRGDVTEAAYVDLGSERGESDSKGIVSTCLYWYFVTVISIVFVLSSSPIV